MRHQWVLRNFVARDLKVKYRGTVLGYLWSLLEPLSLVVLYWFVFVVVAKVDKPNYPLQVILGVLPYNFFSAVVTAGSTALTGNASLIRRVYVPREVFVYAGVGSNLAVYGLSLLAVIPFMVAYRAWPGDQLLVLLPATFFLVVFATGIGLVVACANAIYRDVGYVLRVALRFFFYGSPVVYSLDMVPDSLRNWYLLNPMATFISLTRRAILDQPVNVPLEHLAWAMVVSVGTFVLGARVFARWEKHAVKFL